jgi:hypothetical protein
MLLQSGLPTTDLKTIWDLADPVCAVQKQAHGRACGQAAQMQARRLSGDSWS